MIRPAELIQRKRDGQELGGEELAELVLAYARGDVPDYQLPRSAWPSTSRGSRAPRRSRSPTRWCAAARRSTSAAALGRRVVDKHSTGGVGDKTTLAVGPDRRRVRRAVREDERTRARAHRRDARQARVDSGLPRRADDGGVRSRRCATSGSRSSGRPRDLVPADKKLYALRDVTATVDNVSLIAASIMSKKIAAGADAIVLDVKVGDGAFMKTLADALVLAEAMIALGQRAGRDVVCVLTRHGPAARARGRERARGARGRSRRCAARARPTSPSSCSTRPRTCSRSPTSASTATEARAAPRPAVADGSAYAAYERWVRAQGGDPDEAALPKAPSSARCSRRAAGYVQRARRRLRSGSRRSISAPAGARRTTRSTTPSASSA